MSGRADRAELTTVQGKLLEHVTLNKRLSDQNLELAEEIKTKPAQYITITKEVEKHVCNGRVQQELITAIPAKKEAVNGVNKTMETTADIDDRLPSELIKLLK
jgi:hypothetical protein